MKFKIGDMVKVVYIVKLDAESNAEHERDIKKNLGKVGRITKIYEPPDKFPYELAPEERGFAESELALVNSYEINKTDD